MWETICQFLLLVPLVVYFTIRYYYNYWQRKHIPCVESNIFDLQRYTLPAIEYCAKIYRQLDGHKFGGFYSGFNRKLVIRDPELIKRILIKDFHCFRDRGNVNFDENEPIAMDMFAASGIFWKSKFSDSKCLEMSEDVEEHLSIMIIIVISNYLC